MVHLALPSRAGGNDGLLAVPGSPFSLTTGWGAFQRVFAEASAKSFLVFRATENAYGFA